MIGFGEGASILLYGCVCICKGRVAIEVPFNTSAAISACAMQLETVGQQILFREVKQVSEGSAYRTNCAKYPETSDSSFISKFGRLVDVTRSTYLIQKY